MKSVKKVKKYLTFYGKDIRSLEANRKLIKEDKIIEQIEEIIPTYFEDLRIKFEYEKEAYNNMINSYKEFTNGQNLTDTISLPTLPNIKNDYSSSSPSSSLSEIIPYDEKIDLLVMFLMKILDITVRCEKMEKKICLNFGK